MGQIELDVTIYSDANELVEEVVREALEEIRIGLEKSGQFQLALTGGNVGVEIAKSLAALVNTGEWPGLHIWWSDERFVDLNSEFRNDLEVAKIINAESGVVLHRALGASGDGDLQHAANHLNDEVADFNMGLTILGMGPDGHVASLFPGALHEKEQRAVFAVANSPKPPAERVTFSLKKINESKAIWIIATGSAKAEAVKKLMDQDESIPATHVNVSRLLVDAEAFPLE